MKVRREPSLVGEGLVTNDGRAAADRAPAWKVDPRLRLLALPAFVAVVLALPWLGLPPTQLRIATLTLITMLVVTGLNMSFAYAGELVLGHGAVMAVGAYFAGIIAVRTEGNAILVVAAACLAAAVVGLISGVPGLRLSSWSLAIVTFSFVFMVPDVVSIFSEWTGGFGGLAGIPLPAPLGEPLSLRGMYLFVAITAMAWLVWYRNVLLSRLGVLLLTQRAGSEVGASLGFSAYRAKLKIYVLSTLPAGLAGALTAYYSGFVGASTFSLDQTVGFLAALILGGVGSVYGPLLGSAIIVALPYFARGFDDFALIAYGALLIVGAVLMPDGLIGAARSLVRAAPLSHARVAVRAGLAGPSRLRSEAAPSAKGVAPARLACDHVAVSFGGAVVLRDATFSLQGGIIGLLGPNGSGKTTLLNIISGFVKNSVGTVSIDGNRIDGLPSWRRAHLGLARTFQAPRLPASTLCVEAVAAGCRSAQRWHLLATGFRAPTWRAVESTELAAARAAIDVVGLHEQAMVPVSELTSGQQRLLEIARSIVSEPRLLLLDEPAAGLSESEVERLSQAIRRIADAGATIVLVDHNVPFVAEIADRVIVLDAGAFVFDGPPDLVRSDPTVRKAYLGEGEA